MNIESKLAIALAVACVLACSSESEEPAAPSTTDTSAAGDSASSADAGGLEPDTGAPEPDVPEPPLPDTSSCVHECPADGAHGCVGADTVTCATEKATGCRVWGPAQPCDDGDGCTEDTCSGAGECSAALIAGCLPGCEECPHECTADAKCIGSVCEPAAQYCDGDTLLGCNEDGTKSTVIATCAQGCESGASGPQCVQCTEGEVKCEDAATAMVCQPQGATVDWALADACGSFETCLAGVCKGTLGWSPGDTAEDTLVFFTIHAAACSIMGKPISATPFLCWVLDTSNLKAALDAPGIAGEFCSAVASGTLTEDDFLPVEGASEAELFAEAQALYGCGGSEPGKLVISATAGSIEPGHPLGFYCQVYQAPAGEVRVVPCGDLL